jgi:GNAT superfamily N-acetyltransferase
MANAPVKLVRAATPSDVTAMAALAEAKRELYKDQAPPFQRPAEGARAAHEGFLPKMLERDEFIVLVHEDGSTAVDGFVAARVGSAPPPFGDGPLFHVDDFAVASPDRWSSVGAALLREVTALAIERGAQTAIVVTGPASVDRPKNEFLRSAGLAVGAEWRTKSLSPHEGPVPAMDGFDAAVGPAPPVYDPGGLTCLALRLDDPSVLPAFEEFAERSAAVVGIVPVRAEAVDLRRLLIQRGYAAASEWYCGPSGALVEALSVILYDGLASRLSTGSLSFRGTQGGSPAPG